MKIALIGASGFVGTRLINLLKEDGKYEMMNIDLQHSHFFDEITVIGDVRVQEQMDKLLEGYDQVVLLAAQHRDDVTPTSLYYDTNVGGMEVTLKAMEKNGIKRMVFFSSVAVYGLNKPCPAEDYEPKEPFNHYGKSKLQAEKIAENWFLSHRDWNINIIRPTVIFGERNRGNVYNLLRQIASGHFMMVGKGDNCKSMAYVGNIVAFVKYMIDHVTKGYNVFNYIDKPDMTMNELVPLVSRVLDRHIPSTHLPFWMGMLGGYCFDVIAFITRKKLAISSVRVKKFCATTKFSADKVLNTGFKAPYTLEKGLAKTLEYEFVHPKGDSIIFESE